MAFELVPPPNERQVGGSHYRGKSKSGQQHWDMAWDFSLDMFQYQITKYVMRWRDKNGLQDLEKARHMLEKYIRVIQKESPELTDDGADPLPNGYVNQDRGA